MSSRAQRELSRADRSDLIRFLWTSSEALHRNVYGLHALWSWSACGNRNLYISLESLELDIRQLGRETNTVLYKFQDYGQRLRRACRMTFSGKGSSWAVGKNRGAAGESGGGEKGKGKGKGKKNDKESKWQTTWILSFETVQNKELALYYVGFCFYFCHLEYSLHQLPLGVFLLFLALLGSTVLA